ncbi:glycosyltransferase family 2 protein [Patescibacteria group bacterium]
MKKVSVIIVNINAEKVLKLCLENLKGIYENLEVIVADNSSTDGSAEMIEKEFPWVKLLKLPNNGLSFGFNKCLEVATGDYLLYLGEDSFPNERTIPDLVRYMEENPETGATVAKLLLRDGKQDMDGHRGFPTPWVAFTHFSGLGKLFPKSKRFARYFMTYEDLDKPHEIDATISHFLMVRRNVQEKVGKWDEENFFLYGEDIDMCYRIKQAGYKIMYLPHVTCRHWKGVIVGVRKESRDVATQADTFIFRGEKYDKYSFRVLLRKISTESMLTFYKKYYASKNFFLLNWLVIGAIKTLTYVRVIHQKLIQVGRNP